MKNILKSTLLLMCGMGLFVACADDNDSNPTLQQPSTFVLNEPSYAAQMVALEYSNGINFTWSQPDYGFPAEVSYDIQASPTGSFTVSTDEANADESGATIPDYAVITSGVFGGSGSMDGTYLDRNLVQICQWTESTVPSTQTVYVRLAASTPGAQTIYSNVVAIQTIPFYIALKDAAPELWYLVGECIGDGSWGNSADNIGKAIFPLMTLADETYDKVTGKGVISYTGFFPGGKGFKLIKTPGDWNEQWGAGDAGYVKNDGGSGNITVAADGYYTVKLDTKNDVLTIDPYDGAPRAFTSMGMPGGYQDWNPGGTLMDAMSTVVENHDWMKVMTFEENTELKFAANGGWAVNWGSNTFPVGTGVQNGANIPVEPGTYRIVFNDILGKYYFIRL